MSPSAWSDLDAEQKCVLVNAAESALLLELLRSWEPMADPSDLLTQVPRLARAIVELAGDGLIQVYQSNSIKSDGVLVPIDELAPIVNNPANWWTTDGPVTLVELATTDAATPLFLSRGGADLYEFRNHDQ